jgi:hypothetical protein
VTKLDRWLSSSPPPEVAEMLRAAQAEQPDGRVLRRTLTALGVGTTVSATGAVGTAKAAGMASALAPKASAALLAAKWGAKSRQDSGQLAQAGGERLAGRGRWSDLGVAQGNDSYASETILDAQELSRGWGSANRQPNRPDASGPACECHVLDRHGYTERKLEAIDLFLRRSARHRNQVRSTAEVVLERELASSRRLRHLARSQHLIDLVLQHTEQLPAGLRADHGEFPGLGISM